MKKTDSLNYLFIRLPSGLGNIFCSVIQTIIIFIICIIILSLAIKLLNIYITACFKSIVREKTQ